MKKHCRKHKCSPAKVPDSLLRFSRHSALFCRFLCLTLDSKSTYCSFRHHKSRNMQVFFRGHSDLPQVNVPALVQAFRGLFDFSSWCITHYSTQADLSSFWTFADKNHEHSPYQATGRARDMRVSCAFSNQPQCTFPRANEPPMFPHS